MARVLTVTQTAVAPDEEIEYLEARRQEALQFGSAGDHFWLFRHPSHPGVYLEFRESQDAERLAAVDPRSDLWTEVDLD